MNNNYKKTFKNKTVLIFGGTGSFGSAFLKKAINFEFKQIRIFSRDEKKQHDLRLQYNDSKIKFIIGDIRDRDSVNEACKNVDFVFHAAALKQVPSCEFYPMEAIKTNILGTNNVLDACIANNVKKIVCLSTDKAVYPINAMGMSKALMEKIAIAKSKDLTKNQTQIMITRYGNVLFSRGSILPLLVNKIKNNEPLTITDPEMTRFLMTLDEAIELVLFALKYGKNGQIIIPKTHATNIQTLIDAIKKIHKKENYPTKIIGTRHGEKKHETLMSREESFFSKKIKNFFVINSDTRELNYDLYFRKGKQFSQKYYDYTSENTRQLNLNETINSIKPLVGD